MKREKILILGISALMMLTSVTASAKDNGKKDGNSNKTTFTNPMTFLTLT